TVAGTPKNRHPGRYHADIERHDLIAVVGIAEHLVEPAAAIFLAGGGDDLGAGDAEIDVPRLGMPFAHMYIRQQRPDLDRIYIGAPGHQAITACPLPIFIKPADSRG